MSSVHSDMTLAELGGRAELLCYLSVWGHTQHRQLSLSPSSEAMRKRTGGVGGENLFLGGFPKLLLVKPFCKIFLYLNLFLLILT